MKVDLYTDGSCWHKDRNGGWAFILVWEGQEMEKSGGSRGTTVNQMELSAALKGLNHLRVPCEVTIYSDSQYVCKGMGAWEAGSPSFLNPGYMPDWKNRNWMNSLGAVKNKILWEKMHKQGVYHLSIDCQWIRGHTGHVYNERCDKLAGAARRKLMVDKRPKSGRVKKSRKT